MKSTDDLAPRWDMAAIFPAFKSAEFELAFSNLVIELDKLTTRFEQLGVRKRDTGEIDPQFVAAYEEITNSLNSLQENQRTLGSYISCFVTTDAANDEAKTWQSKYNVQSVRSDQLMTRYVAWVGNSDVEALIDQSALAAPFAYFLKKAREQAQHQMSEAEENLAAELRSSAMTGWARLHGNMSALLSIPVEMDGKPITLPMSAIRALATNKDRHIRWKAYDAELKAWESVSLPFAAALNGIKGYQQIVRKRRGYKDDVEPTLLTNGIDAATLEAMQTACIESFPDFRRYMTSKAAKLGIGKLAWHDLLSPIGQEDKVYSWKEAKSFIVENFAQYSSRLANFADRSFKENWHDAEMRPGKQTGAYCSGIQPGVSRIMLNFDGSYNSVSTLAHELGHAYHNLNLENRPSLVRGSPMTLAETASIFCETLAFESVSAQAPPEEKLSLLNSVLERNLAVVVDIHSRFLFEKSVFAGRSVCDLTVPEFNELMLDSQKQTYGDALESYHPYMWAVKGHYYGPLFYNYPYTFGLLFGLGLYARYEQDKSAFREEYDDFLSSTGQADGITLCRRFGIDITTPAFWRTSLDVIRKQIDEFVSLQ